MIGNHPVELVEGRSALWLILGVLGAFALLCFGPFLYTWATTPWARSSINPSQSLTGQWVGLATVADSGGPKPIPAEGVGDVAIKLQLHLKLLSLSRAMVGTASVCDGNKVVQYDVISGILGQAGHFSAYTRNRDTNGGKGVGSLDGYFSPGRLTLQEGNMAAVLSKGSDADFERQCDALRTHGSFKAGQPYTGSTGH